MYYSKKISSGKRRARRMFRRNTSIVKSFLQQSGIFNEFITKVLLVVSRFKSSKVFNMSHMFKYSISVISIIVFSYVMIYADNFNNYNELMSPDNGLTEIKVKTVDGSVALESIIIDQQQDDGGYLKIKYKVNPGETIGDIAKKFGVTSKNIRSVNKLNSDILEAGQEIVITPVEGFVVENNLGDVNIVDYAKHYGLDSKDLKELNDIVSDTEIIKKGYELFIPLTLDEGLKIGLIDQATVDSIRSKPKPVAPTTIVNTTSGKTTVNNKANTKTTKYNSTIASPSIKAKASSSSYYSSMKGIETYGFYKGQCTAYIAMVRGDVAKQIRAVGGGNARYRYSRAKAAGLPTSKSPSIGAIGVLGTTYGSAGHVGIVISFDSDEVCMKSMNVRGRYIVSEDCFPRSVFIGYIK